MTTFTELSNATAQSSTGSAGPAVVANNSNYDLFVWSNGGTLTLTRGPLWSSDAVRGTGAGTTQISRVLGIWSNTVAITNGPGAGLGTYVGTVRSNGTATIDWNPLPAGAAGGGNAVVGVFNAYNRIQVLAHSLDSTANWSYGTNTWRATNGSTSNRISFIDGLGEVFTRATSSGCSSAGGNNAAVGVNLNSTSATPFHTALSSAGSINYIVPTASGEFGPALGYNYIQAMEVATGSTTWYGAGYGTGSAYSQILTANFMM